MGKIAVFEPALRSGSRFLLVLTVIGVINTAISAYYYLRLIVVMFFRERSVAWHAPRVPASLKFVLAVTILGVFYFGLFPDAMRKVFQRTPGAAAAPPAAVAIK